MKIVSRHFEEYEIGETRTTLGRTITEADVVLHAGQTGDFYPHHIDAEWVKTQPFGRRIAHGTFRGPHGSPGAGVRGMDLGLVSGVQCERDEAEARMTDAPVQIDVELRRERVRPSSGEPARARARAHDLS